MKVITPVMAADANALDFHAKGRVVRVFDQNAVGDLLPVTYQQLGEDSKFRLQHRPAGQVWAEVERPCL